VKPVAAGKVHVQQAQSIKVVYRNAVVFHHDTCDKVPVGNYRVKLRICGKRLFFVCNWSNGCPYLSVGNKAKRTPDNKSLPN